MKLIQGLLASAILLSACSQQTSKTPATPAPAPNPAPAITYPVTKTVDQTDDFFGTTVKDPYRWLENDVRVDEEVEDWVSAQNEVTDAYLATLPDRDAIRDRLTALWDYEKFTIPTKEGDRYFYRRNDGLQNQYVFYVQDGLDAEPRVLIDPNTWSDDGATALASTVPSPDGNFVLYSIQDGGSDWRTLKVLNVETGEPLPDTVEWAKFTFLTWAPDSSGFFYSTYPEPEEGETFQSLNFNQKLWFHQLGNDQAEDRLVYARPENPDHAVQAYAVANRYLIIRMALGTEDIFEIAVLDMTDPASEPVLIIEGFENDYAFIGADGEMLYARTDRNAPRGRIIAIDLTNYAEENWQEIVPQTKAVISDAAIVGGKLVVEYMEDIKSVVRLFEMDGTPAGEVTLPGIGTASGFEGASDDPETFYTFSSFNSPPTIYQYNVQSGESTIFKQPETPFDPSDYVVRQVFYASKDGTKIPMFIAHKQGLDVSAGAPTLLYGYGGFAISIRPRFSITNFAWMEMGGIYALANIRGGYEYGKEWHDGGRLLNKQNVYDDFIAAGEYLISEGLTTADKLSVYGRSNGGLLVGAVVNQRPELFAAALPAVGVMDMLRFDKFTAGRLWTDDYGKPSDNEADFLNNYSWSPYHNIQSGTEYPPVLVTTADTDDRVVPGHSFKYVAALQAAETGNAPKLIRIESRAGHGSGKPTDKVIAEFADKWAFIAHHSGLELPTGYGE